MFRRTGAAVVALAAMASTVFVTTSASASPATLDCAVDWGSLEKTANQGNGGLLVGLRTGRHDCFDRLVFDLDRPQPVEGAGYWVSYVDEVTEDGSGDPVPLRGDAQLQITLYSPAYDESGEPTYEFADRTELADVSGYQTFRQVAWANSFEGTSSIGLGVRARLPFRVLSLTDRVVIDVAHSW